MKIPDFSELCAIRKVQIFLFETFFSHRRIDCDKSFTMETIHKYSRDKVNRCVLHVHCGISAIVFFYFLDHTDLPAPQMS